VLDLGDGVGCLGDSRGARMCGGGGRWRLGRLVWWLNSMGIK
jgi:hypothetical protein